MSKIPVDKFTGRANYSKLMRDEKMPNLLAVQLESYHDFIQTGAKPDNRHLQGIESVFQAIFLDEVNARQALSSPGRSTSSMACRVR